VSADIAVPQGGLNLAAPNGVEVILEIDPREPRMVAVFMERADVTALPQVPVKWIERMETLDQILHF
jgi:hypothetical protein